MSAVPAKKSGVPSRVNTIPVLGAANIFLQNQNSHILKIFGICPVSGNSRPLFYQTKGTALILGGTADLTKTLRAFLETQRALHGATNVQSSLSAHPSLGPVKCNNSSGFRFLISMH